MIKKIKAFTVAETLIVLSILGVVAVMTAFSTVTSDNIKFKKIKALSNSFYSNIENVYQRILAHDTRNGDIRNINGASEESYSLDGDSEVLKNYFMQYFEGIDIACSKLKLTDQTASEIFLNDNIKCFLTPQNIITGVYLDRNCENDYQIKEFYTDGNRNMRLVEKACGYILYEPKDSKGMWGLDVFAIALGKRRIK